MSGAIRCPDCRALNPAGAEWCGQCLARFTPRTPPPPPPPAGGRMPGAAVTPGPSAAPRRGGEVTRRGPFTVTDAGIIWRCPRCDNDNPLEAQICSVCGARFADIVNPPRERPARDPNDVAMYSLFMPGAGHWSMDLKAQGVARAIVSAWVVMVAVLAAIAGATLLAVIFGIAAFGLWGVAAHDAYREARGESQRVILKPRVFVYLVLGLLMLMIVLLVTAGLQAGRG